MNTPASFSLAKLLKEKGYDLSTERFYPKPKCKLFGIDEHGSHYPIVNKTQTYFKGKAAVLKEENYYDAPTISDVVMWLYKKYGIWIVVTPHKGEDDLGKPFMEFDPEVWSFTNECIFHNTKLLYFNSPTEAYEAAIKHTLDNLI